MSSPVLSLAFAALIACVGLTATPAEAQPSAAGASGDARAPGFSIRTVSPQHGAVIRRSIRWDAVTAGPVDHVAYRVDGISRWREDRAPWSHLLDTSTLREGRHRLEVRAVGADGRVVAKHSISVVVDNLVDPPRPGRLLFQDGFDKRSLANWTYVQPNCRLGTPDSAISFVPGLRRGSYAARFRVKHGVHQPSFTQNEACEVTKRRESYRLGKTEFYGHRFRVVGPYSQPYQWGLVNQLAYPTVKYHNLGMNLRDNVTVNFQNGQWQSSKYEHTVWNKAVSSISAGAWQEFIWKVTWATSWKGSVKIWHRLNGTGSWTKVYSKSSAPTQQWGSTEYACVTVEGKGCSNGSNRTTLDKIGIYRAYNPNGQPDTIVDHDVFVVGTSFAAVAARLTSR